jgi:hypothetical protein
VPATLCLSPCHHATDEDPEISPKRNVRYGWLMLVFIEGGGRRGSRRGETEPEARTGRAEQADEVRGALESVQVRARHRRSIDVS